MPTYEYRCPKGHEFEKFQRMSDPPVATCPECGADAERLISAGAGLLFKGEGFYITDYRSEGYKKAAAKEKGGKAEGGSKSDSGTKSGEGSKSGSGPKSESKPAGSGKKDSAKGGGSAASSSD